MSMQGGFQKSSKARVNRSRLIFGTGSKNRNLPIPNVYNPAENSYLHPAIADYEGETNPDGGWEITGYIKEIEIVESFTYQDRQDKSEKKNGLSLNVTFTCLDGLDYSFGADLGDLKEKQFNGTALTLLSQFAALAEKVKEAPTEEGLRNHFYQLGGYLGKPRPNGARYSQTTIREPIGYEYQKNEDGTDNLEVFPLPLFDFKTRVEAPLPPRPEEVYVAELGQSVKKTSHIQEWIFDRKAVIEDVFGPSADVNVDHEEESSDDSDIANQLDEVQTDNLAADLASPAP